jgi:hypothetical protein
LLPPSVQDFVGEEHLAGFVLVLLLEHSILVRSKRLTRASAGTRRLTQG